VIILELTLSDGEFLVKLARKAITTMLTTGEKIEPPKDVNPKLLEKRGVFVTLHTYPDHKLRGCIGFPEPISPLVYATIEAALLSAFEDPRFPPLQLSELDKVIIEVSILTKPKLLKVESPSEYLSKIVIGRDGLLIRRGFYSGLLLPQVPVEEGWNVLEFISYCCLKAGLPPDCWRDLRTQVYTFQSIIFCEESPKGKIILKSIKT